MEINALNVLGNFAVARWNDSAFNLDECTKLEFAKFSHIVSHQMTQSSCKNLSKCMRPFGLRVAQLCVIDK